MRAMRASFVALSFSSLFAISSAHAQPASNAAAEQLFMEGRALMQEGKYEAACPKLAESHRLDPGVGTLLNLGECWEKLGRTASAWATYREAETLARRSAQKERAAHAASKVAALEPALPHLTLDVPKPVPGLVVKRDGEPIAQAAWTTRLPVDPGTHRIEASAEGYKTWTSSIDIHAKDDTHVAVPALEREPVRATPSASTSPSPSTSPSASTTTPDNPGSTQRIIGFAVAGAGVVASGIGLGFGIVAQSKNDEARSDHCSAVDCTQRGADLISDAKEAATISTALVLSGLAIVAVGVVLVLTSPRAASSPRASASFVGVTF